MSDPNAAASPIVVDASAAQEQLTVGIRQAILSLSGVVGTLGATHLSSELGQLATWAGGIAGVITLVMGQIHTLHDHAKKVTMANAAPDAVAVVKGRPGA